jgi:hypothetical protein
MWWCVLSQQLQLKEIVMNAEQAKKAIGLYVATGFSVVTLDGMCVYVKRHANRFKVSYHTHSGLPVERIISL